MIFMEFTYHAILKNYHFDNPKITFLRHNENLVYQVIDQNKTYLLRIHKSIDGFSLKLHQKRFAQKEYIKSEMKILDYLHKYSDIGVQNPLKNKQGDFVSLLDDGTPVTILTWIEGDMLKEDECDQELAYKIGEMVGNLHISMAPLKDYQRYVYNQELVKRMKKEIRVAYQKKHLTNEQKEIVVDTLDFVHKQMDILDKQNEEKVLVHYDLGLSNLIKRGEQITPIDFSLCGYGYYQMDIAAVVINFKDEERRKSLIKGFEDVTNKKVNCSLIETFFAFSVLLFIAFQHEKVHKENWFEKGMLRWEETIFRPLLEGQTFLFKS